FCGTHSRFRRGAGNGYNGRGQALARRVGAGTGTLRMIARLFAPQFVLLYLYAASATYVHLRGKMKLRVGRQLADHSTWLAPYNVLMYMFQAVPNKPVLSVDRFPELAPLRDKWETIRAEALNLFDEGRIKAAANNDDWGFYSFFKSGWKRFYLKWYDDALPSAVKL